MGKQDTKLTPYQIAEARKANHAAFNANPVIAADIPVQPGGIITPPQFAGTPLEGYRAIFQEVQYWPVSPNVDAWNIQKNGLENFEMSLSAHSPDIFDLVNITEGHNYHDLYENGNPKSYGDVLVFPFDKMSGPGFKISDLAEFIAWCEETGAWPKIEHKVGPTDADQAQADPAAAAARKKS